MIIAINVHFKNFNSKFLLFTLTKFKIKTLTKFKIDLSAQLLKFIFFLHEESIKR